MYGFKFLSNDDGHIAILTAIVTATVSGAVGVAVLMNQGNFIETQLQISLDAAVLAGTGLEYGATDSERLKAAQVMFDNQIIAQSAGVHREFNASGSSGPQFTVTNNRVSGTSRATVENSLGAAIGVTQIEVAVMAKAEKMDSSPVCVVTLNAKNDSSFYVYGNASFDADCAVHADSNSSGAAVISGNKSTVTAPMFGVTGGATGSGWSNDPVTGSDPVGDAYAILPVPVAGSCVATDLKIQSTSIVLNPGTYCGGISVLAGASLTLSPGEYIIKDGQLQLGSGAQVNGENVLIGLIGANSYMKMGSNSSMKLTSPIAGTYKNIQFMSDRDLTKSKFNEEWTVMLSGANLEFDGAMYLPEQQLWVSGTDHESVFRAFSPSLAVVVDTLWLQGNAKMDVRQTDRRGIGEVGGVVAFNYGSRLVK